MGDLLRIRSDVKESEDYFSFFFFFLFGISVEFRESIGGDGFFFFRTVILCKQPSRGERFFRVLGSMGELIGKEGLAFIHYGYRFHAEIDFFFAISFDLSLDRFTNAANCNSSSFFFLCRSYPLALSVSSPFVEYIPCSCPFNHLRYHHEKREKKKSPHIRCYQNYPSTHRQWSRKRSPP